MRVALASAVLLLEPIACFACLCFRQPVCSEYGRSPAIFRGIVTERTPIYAVPNQRSSIHGQHYFRVRFTVLETLKGEPQQEITVMTYQGDSMCEFPFAVGGQYVVFTEANAPTGELWTSKCTLTHLVEAGKEDAALTWMRALPTAPAGASIYGRIVLPQDLAGHGRSPVIRLSGAETHDAVPNTTGDYTFQSLQAGTYVISVDMPPGFATSNARTLTVVDKACAQVDWPVYYDGHIRGRVTDADGHPLDKIPVNLQRSDASSDASNNAVTGYASTDSQGRFDFARTAPGEYLVSVNNLGPAPTRPYPRVYYTNADSDSRASSIHLAASAVVDNIDVTLPNAWKPVTVSTRVLQPDGSPAIAARVYARDIEYLSTVEPATTTADGDGYAIFTVYEGRTYYFEAEVSDGAQQRCAGPVQFIAKNGLVLDPITITHNWGNCFAQLSPLFHPPHEASLPTSRGCF